MIKIEEINLNDYSKLVTMLARKYTHNIEFQKDLEQEGYLGLLEAKIKYDPTKNTKFSTFAYLFIKSKMIDFYNKNINNQCSELNFDIESNENILENVIVLEELNDTLDCCSNKAKEIILQKLNGKTTREIANNMGISKSQVSYILSKEKDKLYKKIKKIN